jgi:hypothetical protein
MIASAEKTARPSAELTGVSLNPEAHCRSSGPAAPMSMDWIGEDLIAYTRKVWRAELGREVPREEAVEMLLNVKLVAMAFTEAGNGE